MPLSMLKFIKKEVKEGGYASVSEFLRHLVREWQQEKLLKELNQQTKDFEAGKGIVLKSFKDLDNL